MQREFLQEKSLNRSQDNAEKSLNVDLSAKSKLIPYSTAAGMLGLYDLYTEERDACENYRMIFTVNPICSNVLFNAVTEPVFMEGSYSAINLVETTVERGNTDVFSSNTLNQSGSVVDQVAAIRDTEYSHERIGNFKYHCGYDIFNNHMLRSNDFEHVKLADELKSGKPRNEVEFNTIFDYAIDFSGKTVTRILGEWKGPLTSATLTRDEVRMYQLDNIKSMNAAFYDEMRVIDGWYGFYNSGYINIPNASLDKKSISLNNILNNERPCTFVEMYPDRTLYSFIPKVNRFKKRLERNWDCTIVYPYESDYDTFNLLNQNIVNAVRVINTKIVYNNVGDPMVQMHSLLRHTLKAGDDIRLFYAELDDEAVDTLTRYSVPVRVVGVGKTDGMEPERYFSIKLSDIDTFCEIYKDDEAGTSSLVIKTSSETEGPGKEIKFFYKKVEDGCDDRYYFRKFKEIRNYEYVQCENVPTGETVAQVTKEPTTINENSPKYIKFGTDVFEKVSRPLTYTQNKIAFAENIYGDRVAQVIFNDDICISGLKDNLGRPLSSVYFTAIKTNRGHDDWYTSGITSADTIEYSHCFGDITSGLDLPEDEESTEYNVRKLHNIFVDDCDSEYRDGLNLILVDIPTGNTSGTPTPLETEITLEDYEEFYGDIVEFSKVKFIETPIEKVYHRFNTEQRECLKNKKYYDIHYDEIIGDLYDTDPGEN